MAASDMEMFEAQEHIAALEAEAERLRDVAWRLTKALNDCIEIFVVFDTDTERVIAIEHTVNAALAVALCHLARTGMVLDRCEEGEG
jgi:L-lactate utilization protein LutC